MSTESASSLLELIPHSACAPTADLGLTAQCRRQGPGLMLEYRISGDLSQLHIPANGPHSRQDGLWQTTCLEAFTQPAGQEGYQEYNFSPGGAWACYAFSEYRGQAQSPDCEPPDIQCHMAGDALYLSVRIADVTTGILRIGLSAVLQDNAGQLSYWALHHPADKPDFHDAAGFVLTLE